MFAPMSERLINRRQQGDLGEASAIEWLTRQGATVSAPLGHSPDYDLIAELGGRLLRVQVKTSTHAETKADGRSRWSVLICTNGGNQSWTGTVKLFDPDLADCLFVLVGDGRRWLIPTELLEGSRAVTVGGDKYAEFEIEPVNPILDLVYGGTADPSTIPPSTRGSVEAGESSGPVKSVPMAEWVRIPPPPSARPAAKGERRLGRAGQAIVRGKRQMTVPHRPFAEAGLQVGDRIRFRADGPGRLVVERIEPGPRLPLSDQRPRSN